MSYERLYIGSYVSRRRRAEKFSNLGLYLVLTTARGGQECSCYVLGGGLDPLSGWNAPAREG